MKYQHLTRNISSILLFICAVHGAQAGTWTAPTNITQIGAWGPWFGVVVTDSSAEIGCSGTGTKALDIASITPTKQAQMSLLMMAYTTGKRVKLYYEACVQGTSVIGNVQIVDN